MFKTAAEFLGKFKQMLAEGETLILANDPKVRAMGFVNETTGEFVEIAIMHYRASLDEAAEADVNLWAKFCAKQGYEVPGPMPHIVAPGEWSTPDHGALAEHTDEGLAFMQMVKEYPDRFSY